MLASEEMAAHPTLSESSLHPTATKLPSHKIILGTKTWFMLSLLPGCPHDSCLPCPPASYNQGSLSCRKFPWHTCVPAVSLATLPAAMGCNPQTLRPILEPEDLNPTSLKMKMGPQGLQEDFPGHKENKCQSKSCSGFKM